MRAMRPCVLMHGACERRPYQTPADRLVNAVPWPSFIVCVYRRRNRRARGERKQRIRWAGYGTSVEFFTLSHQRRKVKKHLSRGTLGGACANYGRAFTAPAVMDVNVSIKGPGESGPRATSPLVVVLPTWPPFASQDLASVVMT